MTEREAFEAWMRDTHGPGVNLVRSDDGYISTVPHRAVRMTYASVQMLWEGWQAARAQPAQAVPVPMPPEDWSVFNTGAEVASGLTWAEAWDYMTPSRIERGWSAVCVADKSNIGIVGKEGA